MELDTSTRVRHAYLQDGVLVEERLHCGQLHHLLMTVPHPPSSPSLSIRILILVNILIYRTNEIHVGKRNRH